MAARQVSRWRWETLGAPVILRPGTSPDEAFSYPSEHIAKSRLTVPEMLIFPDTLSRYLAPSVFGCPPVPRVTRMMD